MNKKKSAVILLLIIVISFVAGNYAVRTFLGKENEKYVKNVEDGDVTRYEWMQMPCERVGMTEYENDRTGKDTALPCSAERNNREYLY